MSINLNFDPASFTSIRERDPRMQSYNIEMTDITGGTFWKPYTSAQIEGYEEFVFPEGTKNIGDIMKVLMEPQPPINLYEPRIRTLAAALGPVVLRVSGSWATRTYYDFDGHTGKQPPQGFDNVLTKEQWDGVLDFVKATGAQLMVSVANCIGVHENGTGPWQPDQAELLWDYTQAQGVTIQYAEFMNEPNIFMNAMVPAGYTADNFHRDHNLFAIWLHENHPETTLVGPAAAEVGRDMMGAAQKMMVSTETLMQGLNPQAQIYSYHSYTGMSERGALIGTHYSFSQVLDEDYLGLSMEDLHFHEKIRDKYMPDADMWVTESADAAFGGNTWSPTFAEVIRYLDEMGRFAQNTRGIIFHNTLASAAYGLLEPETHCPRPVYWAALLFSRLAGDVVYDTGEPQREGVHSYAFSRKDGRHGKCCLYINNSKTTSVQFIAPACDVYTLSAEHLRSQQLLLNGKPLHLAVNGMLPEITAQHHQAGTIVLAPCTVSFVLTEDENAVR